jgi:dienelactone hydrolase
MHLEKVTYRADGLAMDSALFYERGPGRRPGVLVFPESFGLGDHAISRAQRLAKLGYVALACDLHGSRRVISDLREVMDVIKLLRTGVTHIRARAQGGLDALERRAEVDPNRIAAIGFCLGGTMALELARSGANLAGVVSFHGSLSTAAPQDAKNIKGKVLVCVGADDPEVPPEQRAGFEQEMRAGKVNWQMNVYGGVLHSFTNPDVHKTGLPPEGFRYDPEADARSWQQMSTFLQEILAHIDN